MPIVEVLAALSQALRLANALADAASTLNNGQPLSPEQVNQIQTAKVESEQTWAAALARLQAKGGAA